MDSQTFVKALAFSAISVFSMPPNADPQPVVVIAKVDMPQEVPDNFLQPDVKQKVYADAGVATYHELRQRFDISHTEMSNWLGVKRRSLYNWMGAPEKSIKYGTQIEARLSNLSALCSEMEEEHIKLLSKIAFSPIYGNSSFGEEIMAGAHADILTVWYDELFPQFESYRFSLGKNLVG